MNEAKKPVLLIDGLNCFTRHFCRNPSMSKNGSPAGGIVGMLNELGSKIDLFDPQLVVVVWEGGGSTRRREIYSDYKNKRKPQKLNRYYSGEIPDTLDNRSWQIASLVQVLSHLPVLQSYVTDCEADDVIGYISRYRCSDKSVVIMSSDKDYYQLLNKDVKIWSPTSKSIITCDDVLERFSCTSTNFILARAFVGDPSDGLKGVSGIGWKTITEKFPELATQKLIELDEIIEKARAEAHSSKLKIWRSILDEESIARRNLRLMQLDTTSLSGTQICKIDSALETYAPSKNRIGFLRALKSADVIVDSEKIWTQFSQLRIENAA